MGKRGRILIAVSAVLAAGIIACVFLAVHSIPREPVYKGMPLSYWLPGYVQGSLSTSTPSPRDADMAVREAGTNAIPLLLRRLRAYDSPPKVKWLVWASAHHIFGVRYTKASILNIEGYRGFQTLGPRAAGAVPELIKIVNGNSDSNSTLYSVKILGNIGPAAEEAVPALLRIASDANQNTRAAALDALVKIQCDPDKLVPVLITALHDPSAEVRPIAAGSLWYFGDKARPAIPALIQIISEPDGGSNSMQVLMPSPYNQDLVLSVRDIAEGALRHIDPEAYFRVITNTPRYLRR